MIHVLNVNKQRQRLSVCVKKGKRKISRRRKLRRKHKFLMKLLSANRLRHKH